MLLGCLTCRESVLLRIKFALWELLTHMRPQAWGAGAGGERRRAGMRGEHVDARWRSVSAGH